MQGESLGESLHLGEGYETYWTYVPHFIHTPFYVYAYAFGDCLVNSCTRFMSRQRGLQDRYMDMLAAGGTKRHANCWRRSGWTPRDPDFWQMGPGRDRGLIDEIGTEVA